MVAEVMSAGRKFDARMIRRYPAGHAVQRVTPAGAEWWQVVYPDQRPAVFAT